MSINIGTVEIAAEDGRSMGLFVAAPDGDGKKPALLVLMEIFGVNAHMKDVTERFANEGYVAISPDLYYRLDERVIPNTDRDGAFAARGTLYDTKVIEDLNRAIAYAKGRDDVDPDRVGIIGYCFGGRVSWMAACNCPGLAAGSLYYGGQIAGGQRGEKSPVEPVTQGNNIKIPMQCVWGGQDQGIPQEALDTIEATLKANNVDYEWHLYEDAGHAFFCDDRPSYHEPSARDIWPKTLAFLGRHLKG